MKTFLTLIIGIIIGAGAGWYFWGRDRREIGEDERMKRERKSKILEEISRSGKITNDEAQQLSGVSDATAERYLDELEAEGKIRQVGKTGIKVYYEKI